MKKLLCTIIALVLVLSLAACGKPAETPETKPTTQPTTAPTVPTTVPPTEPPKAPEFDPMGNKTWAEDGVLKILTIGNSFSRDAMAYVYDIALAAGAEEVYLGDMYIGSCTVARALAYVYQAQNVRCH